MAFAARTVQNMPDCLSREPITVLHPASINYGTNEQRLSSEAWITHPLCVAFEVLGFVEREFRQFGGGRTKLTQCLDNRFDPALIELLQSACCPALATSVIAGKQPR